MARNPKKRTKVLKKTIQQPQREETSYVTCRLCGRSFRALTNKHLQVHETDRKTYMDEFGLTPDLLNAEESRRRRARSPGYFPYRKRELITLMRDIYDAEGALNASFVQTKYPSIYHQVNWLFGTWDEGLRACRLNPDEIHKHQDWPKERILEVLQQSWKSGASLRHSNWKDEYSGMIHAAFRIFGGWREALLAAGIDPEDAGLTEQWSKDEVIFRIRKMGKSSRKGEFGILAKAARRYFGSMKAAVEAAGIDPAYFYGTQFWTEERILDEIKKRNKAGKPMHVAGGVHKDDPRLLNAATKYFGSWEKALREAKIDYSKIRKHQEWSPEKIIQLLKAMENRGEPLWGHSRIKTKYPGLLNAVGRYFGNWTKAILAAEISIEKTRKPAKWNSEKIIKGLKEFFSKERRLYEMPFSLRRAAEGHFGGMKMALEASGVDPSRIYRTRNWSRETLLAAIRERFFKKQPLNYMAVYQEDAGLVSSAAKEFGNWTNALKAAGVSDARHLASPPSLMSKKAA